MATATTIGDVVIEEVGGRFYLTFSGTGALPGRGGGFRSLEAAKDQARAVWNLRLVERLTGEAGRLALSSESTTDRLMRGSRSRRTKNNAKPAGSLTGAVGAWPRGGPR